MEQNISLNDTEQEDIKYWPTLITIDCFLLVSNLIAISANCFIIYIISKIKLRTPTNTFVLNWSILDILHLVTSPGIYNWYRHLHDIYGDRIVELRYSVFFLSFEIGILLLMFVLLFKDNIKCFRERYAYTIGFVWFTTVFIFTVSDIIFTHSDYIQIIFPMLAFVVLQVLLVIVLIVKYIMKCVKKTIYEEDQKLRMYLVTSFVCFWWQFLVIGLTVLATGYHYVLYMPYLYCIVELNVVANLFVLNVYDKRFKMALCRFWKRTADEYTDEINFINNKEDFDDTVP